MMKEGPVETRLAEAIPPIVSSAQSQPDPRSQADLLAEIEGLRSRLDEAEQALTAIQTGEVDALVVSGPAGEQVFSLTGAETVYRQMVETMLEAALHVAPDRCILFCNARFAEFVQTPLEDLVGCDLLDFVEPAEKDRVRELIELCVREPVKQRVVFRASNGASRATHLTGRALQQPDGVSLCFIATDLTELEQSTHQIELLREQKRLIESKQAKLLASRLAAITLRDEAMAARAKTEEALDALCRSEDRLRTLFETMNEGFCTIEMIFDPAGNAVDFRFLEVNQAFEKQTGLRDAPGKRMRELVPNLESHWFEILGPTAVTGEPAHFEREAKALGRYYEVSAYRVGPPEGRNIAILFSEISVRRQGEETLHRLNRTLRALSRSSQAMFHATQEAEYVAEVCQNIRECGHAMVWIGLAENDAAKTVRPVAYAGFEEGYLETLNVTWADTEHGRGPTGTAIRTGAIAMCPDMLSEPAFAPWRAEALKRGYASSLAVPLASSGKTFGVLTIYARQPAAFPPEEVQLLSELAGDLAHGIMTLRQAVARQEAEEQMRVQTTALQAAATAIVITDPAGCIRWVNRAFTRLTGYAAAEAIGRNPRVLKSGAHPPEFYARMWRTVLAGRIWHGELVNKRKDGSTYTEEMTITPVIDAGGAVRHFIAIKQDISERKRAEAALARAKADLERQNLELEQRVAARTASLQQSLAEMERFAYVASHDLQEPLRTISSFSQLLMRRYQGRLDADADEFLNFIVEAAKRMQTLINDLLALSRIGTRGQPFQTVDCGEVLQTAKENLDLAIAESGAVITQDPMPALLADKTQLTQLFQNLFSNAIKFRRNGEAPVIHVSAVRRDKGWHLSVRDNGIGIDPQFFDRIFIVFQRLHDRDQYPGTGIGLAICKKIVERHSGRLWVDSEPGNGSTFHFTIPDAA